MAIPPPWKPPPPKPPPPFPPPPPPPPPLPPPPPPATTATTATSAASTATSACLCARRKQRPGKQGGCQYHRCSSCSHEFSFRWAGAISDHRTSCPASYRCPTPNG